MIDTDDGFVPLLRRRAATRPDDEFARFGEVPLSFRDVDHQSDAAAAWLRALGVGRGDVVALMLRNSPTALALMFAVGKLGAIWVPVNVQGRGDNLGYIIGHCEPRLIVAEADLQPTLRECGADLTAVSLRTADDADRGIAGHGAVSVGAGVLPGTDDTFAIMYTSGTTGRPKGVLVSHRMLRLSAEAVLLISSAQDGDVMFMWEPFYHIGGAQMIVLPLIRRVRLALVERFSAGAFWRQVREHGASHIHFLGGILQILLKQPPSPLDRAHGARIAWGGGCPREVWRPFEERFGLEIRECYGMTECSSITTYNAARVVGAVGRPTPWFDVTLIDPAGGPAAPGARGEIVVRTSLPGAITRGYFKNPDATARALRGGAFHTGDLGSFDAAGTMSFHGRMTDNVRVRGENVTAAEVEEIAAKHPAVEDCAMIGVAAEIGEQEIKLFVKPKAGEALTPAELSGWLATRLAPYQNPRYIAVVADFERTASQRIMKHRLPADLRDVWDRDAARRP